MKKQSFKISVNNYYQLTKPGIIRGNAITATGGLLLASKGAIDFGLFVAMLAGISLVMASACVFNNYIDRDIDKYMARTKNRALVTGAISAPYAIGYASALGILGFLILALYTNQLTALIALFGFFAYVVLYGVGKRRTVHGTVIGSVSGAVPPVIGYVAVTDNIDSAAIILFLILVLWQMPHFYAIAMYRLDEYAKAKIPVMPIKKGIKNTKIQMLFYIDAFIIATILLTIFGYTGYSYGVIMVTLGCVWFWLGLKGFAKNIDDTKWARKMFLFSLVVLMTFSILISVDVYLP